MISRTHRRRTTLGQSFSTCLLMVVLFFGGLGTYYFKVFQWRHLEDPSYDLLIVKKDDPAELAFFRKKTVPDYVDPALMELAKLVKLRKASNAGTVVPEENEQTCTEIANRLKDIMNAAKLRQIPKQYSKKYEELLKGISEIYRGLRAYEDAIDAELPPDKERAIKESIKFTKSADAKLKRARETFFTR